MSNLKDTQQKIGLILIEGYSLMSVASVIEPMRAANSLSGKPLYQVTFIQATKMKGDRAYSSSGAEFDGPHLSEAGQDYDLVFVAAAGNPLSLELPELTNYLRVLMSRRIPLGGVSGGPALLAKAGVMKNRRFTVHWDHRAALQEISDTFLIDRSIYVIDRDRFTCAGGVAPIDMMAALIAAHHGQALAKQVTDWFIYTSVRDASQPQRGSLVQKYNVHHPALINCLQLMQDHLSDPLTCAQLADICGLSERQLTRLFTAHLSSSPWAFYRDLRLQHARRLLEQSSFSILEVALASGFESASHFSAVFKASFGCKPSAVRK